jgi:hypothetical protein
MFMMKIRELIGSKHIHNINYFTRFQTSATVQAPSSGTLSDVSLIAVTDVSGQPIGPIFKVQAVQAVFLDRLTHEDGTCWLFRKSATAIKISLVNIPQNSERLTCFKSLCEWNSDLLLNNITSPNSLRIY